MRCDRTRLRKIVTVGRYGPSLSGRHRLARVKREAADIADRADRPPFISGADRAGGVLDHCNATYALQSALISSIGAARPNRWTATIAFVRGVIAASSAAGCNIERRQINIGEDRFCANIFSTMRTRHPGERRNDHLISGPEFQGQGRQVERGRARRARKSMLDLLLLCDKSLKAFRERTLRDPF